MKSGYGKIVFLFVLVCVASSMAVLPSGGLPGLCSTGVYHVGKEITPGMVSVPDPYNQTLTHYCRVLTYDSSNDRLFFYGMYRSDTGVLEKYQGNIIFMVEDGNWHFVGTPSSYTADTPVGYSEQEVLDFLSASSALTMDNLTDPEWNNVYCNGPPRFDLEADDDGDGRLDYYDLECDRHDEYDLYCEENGLLPGDIKDYQYYQTHSEEAYLAMRANLDDTDLDGFSDGYEIIHGTDEADPMSYPLGRPDVGTNQYIRGGVDSDEPYMYEEYMDSGFSRQHVYDMGYDPFGDTPIEEINADFVGPPDWIAMDSDGDGMSNQNELANNQNPYEFNLNTGSEYIFNEDEGFWEYMGGVTTESDWDWVKRMEEALAAYEEKYESGNYAYEPGSYQFGVAEYDEQLDKFNKIKFNVDDLRPSYDRDFKLNFNIPIPGGNSTVGVISVIPDVSTPGGSALEIVRQCVRAMTAVVMSYVFIKSVWTVIRQY